MCYWCFTRSAFSYSSDKTGVTLNPDQFMSQLRNMLQEQEEEEVLLSDDDITYSSNSSDEGMSLDVVAGHMSVCRRTRRGWAAASHDATDG